MRNERVLGRERRGKLGLSERGRETFNLFCAEAFKQRGAFEQREAAIVFTTQRKLNGNVEDTRNTRLKASRVAALDVF